MVGSQEPVIVLAIIAGALEEIHDPIKLDPVNAGRTVFDSSEFHGNLPGFGMRSKVKADCSAKSRYPHRRQKQSLRFRV
jgi:hypothetical protein